MSSASPRKHSTLISPALLRRWPLPPIDGAAGKEGRGTVLVIGGSEQIPGAAILAATAALRAGAGRVTVATGRSVAPVVAALLPEARVVGLRQSRDGELAPVRQGELRKLVLGCDAVLVGPGVMSPAAGASLFRACSAAIGDAVLIADAAALAGCPLPRGRAARPRAPLILTPHAGEMAHLTGMTKPAILADPQAVAHRAADRLRATVVLKGAKTHVAAAQGAAFHNTAGNIGLGTSGSGDVLSGLIAGLCARGADPVQAAVWAVYLHAKAGEALASALGPLGFLARELLPQLPRLLARFG